MKRFDPFKNLVLDKEEQEIEEALEKGKYRSDPDFKKNKKIFEEAAKNFLELRKTKRITLRVKNEDLLRVKAKAERSNIPYQRLLNLLIHKYADNDLKLAI
jgi:predicted DNA binding CopG/RHH family protein